MSARLEIGDVSDFTFLAGDEVTVPLRVEEAWDRLERDRQVNLLRNVSDRFVGRRILEEYEDGYRCSTTSRWRFRRLQGFESVVFEVPNRRVAELQLGLKSELLLDTLYEDRGPETIIRVDQSYRASRRSLASGGAVAAVQRRAVEIVKARLVAIEQICT